jgi:hypothetical protein
MSNLGQEKIVDIFEAVPFLRSFPFDEYELEINVDGVDIADLGVSPILIDALGTFGTEQYIRFYYDHHGSKTMVSIHVDDILDLQQEAENIQTLDETFRRIKEAIESSDIRKKVSIVKKSKKFIAETGIDALILIQFSEVLAGLAEAEEVEVSQGLSSALLSLVQKSILENTKTQNDRRLVTSYLDFHLHYAMIILGMVIAAKIHTN